MRMRYLVLAKWDENGAATYADEFQESEVPGGLGMALTEAEDRYPDAFSIQVLDLSTGGTQTSTRLMEEVTVQERSDHFTANVGVVPRMVIDGEWRRAR